MSQDLGWLIQLHESFEPSQAADWARGAQPVLMASIPLLSAESYREGFPEVLMELRLLLERFTPESAEQYAHELCDRLADMREILESD